MVNPFVLGGVPWGTVEVDNSHHSYFVRLWGAVKSLTKMSSTRCINKFLLMLNCMQPKKIKSLLLGN